MSTTRFERLFLASRTFLLSGPEDFRLILGEEIGELPAPGRAAGVWVLHPGPGVVQRISGVDEARAMPGVEHLTLRLRPGVRAGERLGAGQEAGHLFVTGRDRDEVARRLVDAYERIQIEMTAV